MTHVLLLLGCAVAIYLACEWFINAVEWLGARLQVGSIAVGSVLAAVGTALPESVVTLVAVVFGRSPKPTRSRSAPRWADRWSSGRSPTGSLERCC